VSVTIHQQINEQTPATIDTKLYKTHRNMMGSISNTKARVINN